MKTKVVELKIYLDRETNRVISELRTVFDKPTLIQILEEYIEECKNEDLPKC